MSEADQRALLPDNQVRGGQLPHGCREIIRVQYNRRTLAGKSSQWVRRHDSQYQIRQGDPQIYTLDKDGIRFLRVIPMAGGTAAYNDIDGYRGGQKYTDDSDITTTVGTRGVLRYRSGNFPSHGPRGRVVAHHTDFWNIRVDHYRLGLDLTSHPFEIPQYFLKYVYYYAMSMALRREGPGQDIKLADHYMLRYKMGVERMQAYRRSFQRARIMRMGAGPEGLAGAGSWGIGEPTLPAYYPFYRW